MTYSTRIRSMVTVVLIVALPLAAWGDVEDAPSDVLQTFPLETDSLRLAFLGVYILAVSLVEVMEPDDDQRELVRDAVVRYLDVATEDMTWPEEMGVALATHTILAMILDGEAETALTAIMD